MLRWKSGSSISHHPHVNSVLNPSKIRHVSRHFSSFDSATFREAATKPTSKYQIYFSRLSDPYVNLSIEHFLLQKTPPHSTVLFMYVNSPCVVIGRNQNPWLETDLKLMRDTRVIGRLNHRKGHENVQLVRRRSGGGTVFHDYGNVNYSVICPTPDFSRDKHAQMVARVLRRDNPRARVNERHDIVLDQGSLQEDGQPNPASMHCKKLHHEDISLPPLKVSGSAYKLTRQRSLHHGTCLLASSNIDVISNYLRSPARPFLKARGVDSVRSPIGNVYDDLRHNSEALVFTFQVGVAEAFADLYEFDKSELSQLTNLDVKTNMEPDFQHTCGYLEEGVENIMEIKTGIEELKVRLLATK